MMLGFCTRHERSRVEKVVGGGRIHRFLREGGVLHGGHSEEAPREQPQQI